MPIGAHAIFIIILFLPLIFLPGKIVNSLEYFLSPFSPTFLLSSGLLALQHHTVSSLYRFCVWVWSLPSHTNIPLSYSHTQQANPRLADCLSGKEKKKRLFPRRLVSMTTAAPSSSPLSVSPPCSAPQFQTPVCHVTPFTPRRAPSSLSLSRSHIHTPGLPPLIIKRGKMRKIKGEQFPT